MNINIKRSPYSYSGKSNVPKEPDKYKEHLKKLKRKPQGVMPGTMTGR